MNFSRLDSSKKWGILTSISDKCIYNYCDGSGLNHLVHLETGEEFFEKCSCREDKMHQEKFKQLSRIPDKFIGLKINDFDISTEIYGEDSEELKKAQSAKLIAINYVKYFEHLDTNTKRGLYFYSATKGSGKTRLACSLANALHKKYNLSVLFTTSVEMLAHVKSTFNQGNTDYTTKDITDIYHTVDILIIDDLGVEKTSEWVVEFLTSLFNTRATNNTITFITSNFPLEQLDFEIPKEQGFNLAKDNYFNKGNKENKENKEEVVKKEPRHDTERILDRIDEMVMRVPLPEVNVRRKVSQKNADLTTKLLLNTDNII